MKVLVVRVNLGIRNYELFTTAFNPVVQTDGCTSFDFDEDYFADDIVTLYSVQDHREQQHKDTAKLIEIHFDLNDRLVAF